jgi:rhodanese-related sulfurtransferase
MGQVSLEELDAARGAGELVVDVRDEAEYSTGHVPGARLMPLQDLPARVHELPKDRPVYIVCEKGGRSAEAARLLTEVRVDARAVAGGTQAWVASGRPIDTRD